MLFSSLCWVCHRWQDGAEEGGRGPCPSPPGLRVPPTTAAEGVRAQGLAGQGVEGPKASKPCSPEGGTVIPCQDVTSMATVSSSPLSHCGVRHDGTGCRDTPTSAHPVPQHPMGPRLRDIRPCLDPGERNGLFPVTSEPPFLAPQLGAAAAQSPLLPPNRVPGLPELPRAAQPGLAPCPQRGEGKVYGFQKTGGVRGGGRLSASLAGAARAESSAAPQRW